MSFAVTLQRNFLPIINGFVIVPDLANDVRVALADALTAVENSTITVSFIDRQQRLFVIPDFISNSLYPTDHYAALRAVAAANNTT